MAASTIYSIPGYLGKLQVTYANSASSPSFGPSLPFSKFEYGGGCQPRGIYLASGIPYPDVFPERQTLTMWAFAGPARNDFNPWTTSSGYFANLAGPPATLFTVGQLVTAQFTLYNGTANLGNQIGGTSAAIVVDFHWSGEARGQSIWRFTLAAAWTYKRLGAAYNSAGLFRAQGADSSYNIPAS